MGKNGWNQISNLPDHLKSPHNKDLYLMTSMEKYLAFISHFNNIQKLLISKIVTYAEKVNFPYKVFPLKEDEQIWHKSLKDHWSFI